MTALAWRTALLGLAALAGVAPELSGQAPGPLTIEKFLALKAVSDPQLSPDGRLVAFSVSTPSLEDNKNQSRIWLSDLGSGETWEATSGAGSERAPRWAPDGKTLAYISTREDGAQIWRLPIRGGEPVRLSVGAGGRVGLLVVAEREGALLREGRVLARRPGDQPPERTLSRPRRSSGPTCSTGTGTSGGSACASTCSAWISVTPPAPT